MKQPAAVVLEGVTAAALGGALLVFWTGGWRAEFAGVTLSMRSAWRPLALAGVLLTVRWMAARGESRVGGLAEATARVVAGAMLVAGMLAWTTYLSPYVGGSDSYGYVSAAERIRAGALIQQEPLAALLPYPNSVAPATPLGYVASPRVANATVPAYPLGLPALMALAASVGGPRAPLYVPLVMGLVLVGVCTWLVYRWSDDALTALAAGAALTMHPVVFTYTLQPMSDVPAAAFSAIAAALLLRQRSVLAALAAGTAVLIRPALLPGVAALALIPVAFGQRRLSRVVAYGAVLSLFAAFQAWLQWYLYGSAQMSGYGPANEIFGLRHLGINARSYAHWIVATHGVVWIAALAAGLATVRSNAARALIAAALIGAIVPYAIYRPYDHWETQRFILPFLVTATVVGVVGLFNVFRHVPYVGRALALTLVIVMAIGWARWLERQNVLQLAIAESRFAQAGELVTRVTPADAVVLASLHSGSVRYYARRSTLEWGKIPVGQFDATVTALEQQGLKVFLLLDGDEERTQFVTRHGDVVNQGGWLPSGQRRDVRLYESVRRAR